MRLISLIAAAAALTMVFAGFQAQKNATCPVSGGAIDSAKAVKYTHNGKELAFCCGGCVTKFKADPAKYLKVQTASVKTEAKTAAKTDDCCAEGKTEAMKAECCAEGGQAKDACCAEPKTMEAKASAKPAAVMCAVHKTAVKDAKKSVTLAHNKQTLHFCTAACRDTFKKNPAKFMTAAKAPAKAPVKK